MSDTYSEEWLDEIRWNDQGLVSATVQDAENGRVLMQAWMNRDALQKTQQTGLATYWSRSRNILWQKGESSGHVQRIREIRLDCDNDSILLVVEQAGGIACHTGRASCFYRVLKDESWEAVDPVLKDPDEIYTK